MIPLRAHRENETGRLRRWAAFYFVGGLGFLVQLASLHVLVEGFGLHYLVATAAAVEAAIVHNFLWHEHWTWADRRQSGPVGLAGRAVRFHLANGAISMAGNILMMKILVGTCALDFMPANLIAVATCSVLNFLAGDMFVFPRIARRCQAIGD